MGALPTVTIPPGDAHGDLPTTLGTGGTLKQLRLPSISASGNSSIPLTIQGDVTLVITATAGGSAITPGAPVKISTEGNLAIGGHGVANYGTTTPTANQSIGFKVRKTRSSPSPTILIAGNGEDPKPPTPT
mgnify:CR=1 FL=1